MRALTLRVDELTEADLDAWRALAGRAAEPNPFFEPSFVVAAARHLEADDVSLLVIAEGSQWTACLPLVSRSLWHRFPARWLTTWRHPYCYLGTPLVDRACCDSAVEALVTGIHESGGLRLVALELLGSQGPISRALATALAKRGKPRLTYESFERAGLHRRDEPTYLDQTLRRSRGKELRRLGRRLGEELEGDIDVRDMARDPGAIDEFLRLEASGWKGREATALASDPAHAAFFQELCDSFGEDGRLQLLALGTPERAVAMQCNLTGDGTLFCFKVAYDDQLARYSPGVQLEVRAVDAFHAQPDVSVMDSCSGPDNQLVNRLWPDRLSLATVVVPARGLGSRVLLFGLELALAFRRRAASRGAEAQVEASPLPGLPSPAVPRL